MKGSYDTNDKYGRDVKHECVTVRAPADHVIMLSVHPVEEGLDIANSDYDPWECYFVFLTLYEKEECSGAYKWDLCSSFFPATKLYYTKVISLQFALQNRYPSFRVLFTFHGAADPPKKFQDGRWDCSGAQWESLKQHLLCNEDLECSDARDETNCNSTSSYCGSGLVLIGRKCYMFSRQKKDEPVSWFNASDWCAMRGGHLPNLVTHEEWYSVWEFLKYKQFNWVFLGLTTATPALPYMYLREWYWTNGNIAFYAFVQDIFQPPPVCAGFVFQTRQHTAFVYERLFGDPDSIRSRLPRHLEVIKCDSITSAALLCEMDSAPGTNVFSATEERPRTIRLQIPKAESSEADLVSCPVNHMTHNFLACDVHSSCWQQGYGATASCDVAMTPLPPSFTCKNEIEHVPYTLVCDHRSDCNDDSDESFCAFPPCDPLTYFFCSDNQECILREEECDGVPQCINGVDEEYCGSYPERRYNYTPLQPPALITLDATGWFNMEPINNFTSCPETHFQCPGDGYCLPVYVRCNGVYDCPGREDEAACDSYTCPGFYRCRASRVCVHPIHLCDGVFQCTQHDDELLCGGRLCPNGCTCYGHAFYCARTFTAAAFPDLRFLDASDSRLSPSDLTNNTMLVFLSLARCGLSSLPALDFPNLLTLDISHNGLTIVRGDNLLKLPHLRYLSVADNPITSLVSMASSGLTLTSLRTLDVSGLDVEELESVVFSVLPNIQTLNLSDSGLTRLTSEGFQPLKQLRELDLRGCPVTVLPKHVFRALTKLRRVFADNFKFCCPAMLPEGFNPNNCHAPIDEISSCESLLRSETFRAFLSVFAVFALVGNCGCFVYRVFIKNVAENMGFDVFVTHLSVSDFLMGVYLAVIGVADRLYLGSYLWEDISWRHSPVCHVAGFLSLLSNEVSAFIVCLITMERFLVVRFPFSNIRFRRRSAQLACAVAWGVGHVLALVPLLPVASHWQFYSQSGICIPLPVTRKDFPGSSYSYAVLIVLNFVLFLLIAVGQLLIYWSIRKNEMSASYHPTTASDDDDCGRPGANKPEGHTVAKIMSSTDNVIASTRTSKDYVIARRLVTIVVSDFICWFPIGVLGILATNGVPIPGEANVVVAIFVLPLNSALNPFLYTLNVILERRRKAEEARMLKAITSQLRETGPDKRGDDGRVVYTADEAWKLFEELLKYRVVSRDDVQQFVDSHVDDSNK